MSYDEERKMLQKHWEVIVYSAMFGLLFPISFLLSEHEKCKEIYWNIYPFIVLFLLAILGFLFIKGSLIRVSNSAMRIALYLYGISIILSSGILIHNTGGITESIFTGLLEYAVILSIIIREGKWRSVVIVSIVSLITIFILHYHPSEKFISKFSTITIWASISIGITITLSVFSAIVHEKLYEDQ